MIRPATTKEASILTTISFSSKRYWNYPDAYFDIWADELTINDEYIEKNTVFVYEQNTRPIGYYSIVKLDCDMKVSEITISKGHWLDHMFILPENIGRGIGTQLFNHLKSFCKSSDIYKINMLADPYAREFYEKMGCEFKKEYPSTIKGRTTPLLSIRL